MQCPYNRGSYNQQFGSDNQQPSGHQTQNLGYSYSYPPLFIPQQQTPQPMYSNQNIYHLGWSQFCASQFETEQLKAEIDRIQAEIDQIKKEKTDAENAAKEAAEKKALDEKIAKMYLHFERIRSTLSSVHQNELKTASSIGRKVDEALKEPSVETSDNEDELPQPSTKKESKPPPKKKLSSLQEKNKDHISNEAKLRSQVIKLINNPDDKDFMNNFSEFCEIHKLEIDENEPIEAAIDTLLKFAKKHTKKFKISSA